MPDFLVVRGSGTIDERRKGLLARFSDLNTDHTIAAPDVDNIYKVPKLFFEQKFDTTILEDFGLPTKTLKVEKLDKLLNAFYLKPKSEVNITIAGKYFQTGDHKLLDAYFALIESIRHASWKLQIKVNLNCVNTEDIEKQGVDLLKCSDAIIVPIGWGTRGVEGKIIATKYARENKIPFLGLCYGMQLACVEYARNVIGWKDANTEEVNPKSKHKIIHSIPFNKKYQTIKGHGVSMRLGSFVSKIKRTSLTWEIYDKYKQWDDLKNPGTVTERHRHRYEFNNEFKQAIEKAGLIISGTSPDRFFVENIELSKSEHPFFIATQAHPEYKSTPWKPHAMFLELLEQAKLNKK
jgi:CTP synthase